MTDEQIARAADLLGVSPAFLARLEIDLAAPIGPTPAPASLRWPYTPMDDATWAVIAPLWGEAAQARVPSRAIVDALLMKTTTVCPWDAVARFAPPEAARNQLKRRARSGGLLALLDVVRNKLSADRMDQLARLAGKRATAAAGCQSGVTPSSIGG